MERMLRIRKREDCPYHSLKAATCAITNTTCILDEKRVFEDGILQPNVMHCILEVAPQSKSNIMEALENPNPFNPIVDYVPQNVIDFWKKGVMWASNVFPEKEDE